MKRVSAFAIVVGLIGLQALQASTPPTGKRNGHVLTFWPDGHPRSDATYRDDAYAGTYRTWYESGGAYELRHSVNGHESGLQQSWTEKGELYLNYEVRNGRRFGLVNPAPCVTVAATGGSGVPYYNDRDFTPAWSPVPHHVAPFRLLTQTGAAISVSSLAGRVYVASFIFTRCAAVCPSSCRS